jgi:hypothetical protein
MKEIISYKNPFKIIISLSILGILLVITGSIAPYIDPIFVLRYSFFGLCIGIISEGIQVKNYYGQPKILWMAIIVLICALLLYKPYQDVWVQMYISLTIIYILILKIFKIL